MRLGYIIPTYDSKIEILRRMLPIRVAKSKVVEE
jgi:hypothetical protein